MKPQRTLSFVAFVAVCVFWGTTAPAIRFAVRYFPPLLLAGVRFGVAGSLLLSILVALGKGPSRWSAAIGRSAPGGLFLALANSLTCVGFKTVQSGQGALLLATTALWMTIIDSIWPTCARRTTLLAWVGLGVGLGGVALLIDTRDPGTASSWGATLLLISSLSWASGSVWQSRRPSHITPFLEAALQMLVASAVLIPFAYAIGERWQQNLPSSAWVAFAFLTLTGSLIGFVSFVYILRTLPSQIVGLYTYVNPVVAAWAGWWWLDESIGSRLGLASILVLGSVALVRFADHRSRGRQLEAAAADSTLPPLEPSA